jgi:hypothetical protein
VHDDIHQQDFLPEGHPVQNSESAEVFNAVLTNYYKFNEAKDFLSFFTTTPASIVPFSTMPHPIQPLMFKECGFSFPISSSYETPQHDRQIRKVLLLHMSNFTGEIELESVGEFFRSKNVTVELHTGAELTIDEILAYYHDESYDVVWISSHGEFLDNDPHLSQFHISGESEKTGKCGTITLRDLMLRKFTGNGRRLLFLNFCFGGAAQIIQAPPRYGLAPILASKNQAVMSHLWPTSLIAGPAFGSLIAIGLMEYDSYFLAFDFAVKKIIEGRAEILRVLEVSGPYFERISSLIDRSSLDLDTISTWGSPIFYE